MARINLKSIGYIVISIIAGLASSVATFFILILLFIATGLFGWSDSGDAK